MTVREAMEALAQLPPDAPVLVNGGVADFQPGFRDAVLVTKQVAPRRPGSEYYSRFEHLPERNTLTAVVLE
jgi:hypothetical protein